MRTWWKGLGGCLLVLLLFSCGGMAEEIHSEEKSAELPEWTVMFYLCGSDLESQNSYASGNLKEIAGCTSYAYQWNAAHWGEDQIPYDTQVNVVLETGGSQAWHAQELGMDIRTDRLQRWVYTPPREIALEAQGSFSLVEDAPLASMGAPETLGDFIAWAAERYPAKKYALVLWDHGAGAKTGLMIDELFDGDMLYLYELKEALAAGGVDFEAVLFDACLMANLEAACAVADHAEWMVASEELVAGKGTAMGGWLQQLYLTPSWDGLRLGHWICQMTEDKYANEEDEQTQDTLTWSVIHLKGAQALAAQFDAFFEEVAGAYEGNILKMRLSTVSLGGLRVFGLGDNHMLDIGAFLYEGSLAGVLPRSLYEGLLSAMEDCVAMHINGSGRAGTWGLSFCFAADLSPDELDIYARNCPLPHYLALLDAISPAWDAPEELYAQVDRLTDIRQIPDYQIQLGLSVNDQGIPAFSVESGLWNISAVYAQLHRVEEKSGELLTLGNMLLLPAADPATEKTRYAAPFGTWLTLEGKLCSMELVMHNDNGFLYNLPVRIGTDVCQLRFGYDAWGKKLQLYGIWVGYDADSDTFNRNVIPLAKAAGQEFTLLYPIDGTERAGKIRYASSEAMTMYRSLKIGMSPLPAGTYVLEYLVRDMFRRTLPVGRVEIAWDGEKISLPHPEAWEGMITLDVSQGETIVP